MIHLVWSLKTCCLLQSLETCWVLWVLVPLLAIWKGWYQTFMDGKCFYIQSCAGCCWWQKKQYSLNCSCTLKQWGTVILFHYEGCLCTQVHQLWRILLHKELQIPLIMATLWTHYLLKNPSLKRWEQWMYIYPHSSELHLYPFQSYFSFLGDFRKFLKESNPSVCPS